MVMFLTIVSAVAAIGFFLYLLSAVDNAQISSSEKKREAEQNKRIGEDPRKVYNKEWDPGVPRPRICPVCGKYLKKNEFLYASIDEHVVGGMKRQAHIYGCRFCYMGMTDESSDKEMIDL